MQQILLKEFQQDLFYNNDNNILLIENETSNISLIIKSNIYIDNGISTTVNISFKYKTSLDAPYKTKSTTIDFYYRPVPITLYLNTDSSHLYIKNFKIEFLYNGEYYRTDQDFFRDFNCFNLYTEDNADEYKLYIDTNMGIIDEDSYNSMQNPLMIEAIVDGWIHLMPHNEPGYTQNEYPYIWYKIDNNEPNMLYLENNDNDEVEDILVGHGNLEDDNPFNDYHHYVIPIKQGETIYLFSPNLDRMVLVFFSTKKNEERWDEDIEVEVYNEQQIDDDIDDMTANELLAQIQALNTRIQTLESNISEKQNTISDLNTIRSGAALGATAIQQHQDLSNYATTNYVDSSITSVYNYINSNLNINNTNNNVAVTEIIDNNTINIEIHINDIILNSLNYEKSIIFDITPIKIKNIDTFLSNCTDIILRKNNTIIGGNIYTDISSTPQEIDIDEIDDMQSYLQDNFHLTDLNEHGIYYNSQLEFEFTIKNSQGRMSDNAVFRSDELIEDILTDTFGYISFHDEYDYFDESTHNDEELITYSYTGLIIYRDPSTDNTFLRGIYKIKTKDFPNNTYTMGVSTRPTGVVTYYSTNNILDYCDYSLNEFNNIKQQLLNTYSNITLYTNIS